MASSVETVTISFQLSIRKLSVSFRDYKSKDDIGEKERYLGRTGEMLRDTETRVATFSSRLPYSIHKQTANTCCPRQFRREVRRRKNTDSLDISIFYKCTSRL